MQRVLAWRLFLADAKSASFGENMDLEKEKKKKIKCEMRCRSWIRSARCTEWKESERLGMIHNG